MIRIISLVYNACISSSTLRLSVVILFQGQLCMRLPSLCFAVVHMPLLEMLRLYMPQISSRYCCQGSILILLSELDLDISWQMPPEAFPGAFRMQIVLFLLVAWCLS